MKKKLLACAVTVAMSFGMLASVDFNAEAASYKEVTSNWLTVRTGPSANYKAIDWIKKGTDVTVYGTKNGWDHIKYAGKSGYVSSKYLKQEGKTTSVPSKKYKKVTAYSLTVRSGPSPNYKVTSYLKKDAVVEVISTKGKWDYISFNGKKGYVYNPYLTVTSASVVKKPETKPVASVYKKVTAYSLTVRTGPSPDYKAISYLKKDAVVQVISTKGKWDYISLNGMKGYVNNSYLTLTTGKTSAPVPKPAEPVKGVLSGKEIVLDPGHGGRFNGAHGIVIEESVNLQIALKVRDILESLGAKVIMTRTTDVACTPLGFTYSQDLSCRPGVAIKNDSDMFVSIHANAGVSTAYGTETFYRNGGRGDQKLAQSIYNELTTTGEMRGRGVKYADFAVLRHSGYSIPSTLIETGFVTNPSDAAKLGSVSHQVKLAKAIANGIAKYFK